MDIINLKKLVQFSEDKGLLDTMEKRRRVKKDLLKHDALTLCLSASREAKRFHRVQNHMTFAFTLWKVREHLRWATRKPTCRLVR